MMTYYKSGWEKIIAKKALKWKINCYYEPFSFYLTKQIKYTPDFVVSQHRKNGKIILLEPHGIMRKRDENKYALFKEQFGEDFSLTLFMKNDDIPNISPDTYDDIWPIEYCDIYLQRLKQNIIGTDLNLNLKHQ